MYALPSKLFLLLRRFRRGLTFGIRAIVLNYEGHVLLVKHSYVAGWYLPGGGVEAGETFQQALEKELLEEVNIELAGPPELLAVFQNQNISKRDHVAVYHCPEWRQDAPPMVPNKEIIAAEFFPINGLPEGTTKATRARLEEFQAGGPFPAQW